MEITDTKELQIKSLLCFAGALGYMPNQEDLTKGFAHIDMNSWHTHYISLSDMIRLHNKEYPDMAYLGINLSISNINPELDIPISFLDVAIRKKLVQKVKLQKSGNSIKVQSNDVVMTVRGTLLYGGEYVY